MIISKQDIRKACCKYFPKPKKQMLILKFIKKRDIEKPQTEVFAHYHTILSRFSQFRTFEKRATFQKCSGSVALDKRDLANM
jgi:hypothetical protein